MRDKGKRQFLYEVKFIENTKSSQQGMPTDADSPAPNGDAENNNIIPENPKCVKMDFSLEENEINDAIDLADDKNLSVRIENQSGAKKYKIIRDCILETLGGNLLFSVMELWQNQIGQMHCTWLTSLQIEKCVYLKK